MFFLDLPNGQTHRSAKCVRDFGEGEKMEQVSWPNTCSKKERERFFSGGLRINKHGDLKFDRKERRKFSRCDSTEIVLKVVRYVLID